MWSIWTFSVVVFALTTGTYLLLFLSKDGLPDATGTQKIKSPLDDYGFGPEKQLLIFEVDHAKIEMKDKIFARMQWSTTSGTTNQTIGIEIKGSGPDERRKLNFAFEIWDASDETQSPCVSIETCEDDKAELFDFGEKYEDYVLRGGYNEPTFVRDSVASQLAGGILQHTMVEVLFRRPDGALTYEGVYILYPAIQRRVLEKRLDWSNKGKAECDEEPDEEDNSAMIGEFTIEGKNGRKAPCSEFDLDVKMRYPKCDMAQCFYDRLHHFFSVLTLKNTSEVHLNLDSFVNTYLAEMLMREDDFPYTSQYFYISPDDNALNSGPRWDYDKEFWRVCPTDTWDLFNLHYYNRGPIDFWVHLGKHQPFIDRVNAAATTIDTNFNITKQLIEKRRGQLASGFFDKNIHRWNTFGKQTYSRTENILYAVYGTDAGARPTMEQELDRMAAYFESRTVWMKNNLPVKSFGVRHFDMVMWVVIYCIPLILAGIFVVVTSFLLWHSRNTKDTPRGMYAPVQALKY